MATWPQPNRDVLGIWLPLLTLAALGWSWYHVLRLREHAIAHARRLCEQRGLQLLDDSVSLHRLRLDRRDGALHVLREYRFETSLGGNDRQAASISLLGGRVVGENLPPLERFEAPVPQVPGGCPAPLPTPQMPPASNVVPIARIRRTLH